MIPSEGANLFSYKNKVKGDKNPFQSTGFRNIISPKVKQDEKNEIRKMKL